MANAATWFEIPSTDFERAATFYDTIFGITLRRELFNGEKNAIFPSGQAESGGAIIFNDTAPSSSGSVVYLNAGMRDNLDQILARVEPAGGQVLLPTTYIGDPGFIAMILDSEGNRVGLHSQQ